jgi:hypothetical protein
MFCAFQHLTKAKRYRHRISAASKRQLITFRNPSMEIHCAPIGLSSSTLSTLLKRWKKNVSAILLKVALEITKLRQTDPYKNIFPALNEALELCMSKSPADLRNENGGCLEPTLRENLINDDCLSWSTPFQLNAHRFVQGI